MNGNNITEEKALEERAKFIGAFNGTMIDIWKEKIVDMDIIDTGSLLDSVTALPVRADGRFSEVVLVQCFLEYGLWQDYGTGREVWRGKPRGYISRTKRSEESKRASPMVLDQILLVGDELARFYG